MRRARGQGSDESDDRAGFERHGEASMNACGRLEPLASAEDAREGRIAPRTAMPIAPPTWRKRFSTPEAMPALATGTLYIAAAVSGDCVAAMPIPARTSPGRRFQKPDYVPSIDR